MELHYKVSTRINKFLFLTPVRTFDYYKIHLDVHYM